MNHEPRERRRRTASALLATAAFVAVAVLPRPVRAAASPLSVNQIIDRNVEARGGLQNWRAVKTLSMSGMLDAGKVSPDARKLVEETRRAPGQPRKRLRPELTRAEAKADTTIRLPYLIELKRPGQMRVELKVNDQTAVQVFDGKQGWKLRPFIGRHEVEPFTADELKLAARQQELDGPLVDHVSKGTRVEAAGVDKVDGRDAYKLKLTLKTGDKIDLWIDSQSFLDVKLEAPRRVGGKERPVATYMRDYRRVNGLMLPFQLEDRVAGAPASQFIDVQQVAVNPSLPESHFEKLQ